MKGEITLHFFRKMPPGGSPSQPGKIVEITYQEVNSKLRLSDSPGASSAHSPVLIREEFITFACKKSGLVCFFKGKITSKGQIFLRKGRDFIN